ncbi:MAG: class I SAM-dependent methyltransferase [Candidatus Undinarchaeales archaeon]|nr:class I SAM-dependent methyltransferase [Candidatus Undinarchaeales archaeon]
MQGDGDFKALNEFAGIRSPTELTKYYLEHESIIPSKTFIKKYITLTSNSTEECYTSAADDYTKHCVMPILNKEENLDPIIKAQLEMEEKFIEDHIIDGCTLLDVGCGPGRIPFTYHKEPKIKKIYAFDISRTMLTKAQELKKILKVNGKITFFRADAVNLQKLQLKTPVIATCMFGTIGNIPLGDDRVTAFKNIKENIPSGHFLFSVFNRDKIEKARDYYKKHGNVYGEDIVEIRNDADDKTYFFSPTTKFFSTWYSKEAILDELAQAGLKGKIHAEKELILVRCDITEEKC